MSANSCDLKCRICLTEDTNEFLSIFSINQNIKSSLTNAELMMACSSVQIIENDELPKNICRICCDKLSQFYEFKLLCENSDKILHINAVKQEEIYTDLVYFEEKYRVDEDSTLKSDTEEEKNASEEDYFKIKKELICPSCKESFNTKDELRIHFEDCIRKLSNFEKSNTASAGNNNKIKRSSKNILTKKESINDSLCFICNKSFENIKEHYKEVHKTGICPTCGKSFTTLHYFINHLRQHVKIKRDDKKKHVYDSLCLICNVNFENIKEHYKDAHKTGICPTCRKSFSTLRYFIAHLSQGCHGPRKYLCSHCGRCFKLKGNLQQHIMTHTGEKPHVCDVCNKAFAFRTTLRRHQIVHSTEKNYACELCGKVFARLYSLKLHLVSHSDERKYSCEVCEQKFKSLKDVKGHMVTHTGIKNFKCDVCEKEFGFKRNLIVHRRTHTGDRPFVCEICCQRFTQSHSLRSHMESRHKCLQLIESNSN